MTWFGNLNIKYGTSDETINKHIEKNTAQKDVPSAIIGLAISLINSDATRGNIVPSITKTNLIHKVSISYISPNKKSNT